MVVCRSFVVLFFFFKQKTAYEMRISDWSSDVCSSACKSKAPTWTIGVDWKASDELFLYATSRRGYKTGGINAPAYGPGLRPYQTFAPEKTTDIELGATPAFRFGATRLRSNASVFRAKPKVTHAIATRVTTPHNSEAPGEG